MHARDTHRLTCRSITRSVVACARRAWRSSERRGRRSQTEAGSLSQQRAPPSGVAFSAASDAAVRSLAGARTRPQKPYAEWSGAHCCCRCSAHGTRRRARQPLECARPCGERERIGVGGGLVGRAPLSRAHAGGRAPREGGGTWSPRASPLRQFGLSRSRRRSYGNGTHYRCRCLMPCIGVCTQCTRPAAEPTATLHAS